MYNMIVEVEVFSTLWKGIFKTGYSAYDRYISIRKYNLRKEVNVRWQKSI